MAVLGTGCGSSAGTTTTSSEPPSAAFITYRPQEGDAPLGDAPGYLVLDDGCIWLEVSPDEPRFFAMWPEGWTAEDTGDGIEIHRPDGTVVPFGVPFLFPGGVVSHETAAALVTAPIPMRCLDLGEYMVFDVLPAASE